MILITNERNGDAIKLVTALSENLNRAAAEVSLLRAAAGCADASNYHHKGGSGPLAIDGLLAKRRNVAPRP
jgi:hypothetical protein